MLEDRSVPSHGGSVEASTLVDNGPAANRVDIVFLGDGYTAADIDTTYPLHIATALEHLFNEGEDPFPRYRNFFNVYRVNVISTDSGIDDPSEGIFKNTALDAAYDCAGIDRLICINNSKADSFLEHAPAPVDIRLITVNSTQYGGSGGSYAVYAGGDSASAEIALHELGHTFNQLADEYSYFNGSTYSGTEPSEVNVTKSPTGDKWAEWLGYDQPGIGVIGAYEGAKYNDFGLYRPSNNSKMRSLNQPFDAISREKIIQDIYALVDPLDAWRDNSAAVGSGASLWVQVLDPTVIQTEWLVDGVLVSGANGTGFRPSNFGFAAGTHTVTARSYDPTDWVRRGKDALEQTQSWTIESAIPSLGAQFTESDGQTELFEGAAADSYTLVLDSAPTSPVTITLTPDNQLDVSPRTATFTPDNWNVPQTFMVSANSDAANEGLHLGRVSHQVASADTAYNLLPLPSLVAVVNDLTPAVGIQVDPTASLVTAENGKQATFTVVLTSAPTADVTIALSSTNPALGTVSPVILTFTRANAFTPQTVTITGQDDGLAAGNTFYTIVTQPAMSTDPDYNGLNPRDVSVTSISFLPKKATFVDQDGDVYTLSLSGPGQMLMIPADSDGDRKGPIDLIAVKNTDPAKSTLTINVKKSPMGDGRVSIGSIQGSGLRSITATSSNLTGTGVDLAGRLGNLKIRDIRAGVSIQATGVPAQKTSIKAHVIEDGVTFNLGTTISYFTAATMGTGSITAPSIAQLAITGDAKNKVGSVLTPILGKFKADLTIRGSGDPKKPISLRTVRISGDALNVAWHVTGAIGSITAKNWLGGSITAASLGRLSIKEDFTGELTLSGNGISTGKAVLKSATIGRTVEASKFDVGGMVSNFKAAEFINSSLLLSYTPTSPGDPFAGGTFAARAKLAHFRIFGIEDDSEPAFRNSVVAATSLGNVFLKSIDDTNSGTQFGLLAGEGINSLTITMPSLKLKKIAATPFLNPDFGDFEIRVN